MDILQREVAEVVTTLCQDLNTPRSLTVFLLVKNHEYDQLANLRCDPSVYLDAESFCVDNSITELLRKNADLPTSVDKRAAAVANFFSSERICADTNARLVPYLLQYGEDYAISKFFDLVKKELAQILGRTPNSDDLHGRFGPGSVFESKDGRTLVPDKISAIPTLTENACCFVPLWSMTAWGRNSGAFDKSISCVRGNRFTTVPKTSLTDRGICVEPSINGFYQASIGSLIRKKLLRIGLDLDSAQVTHRRMACEASAKDHLITVDLSNASDTVAYNLVKLLLPEGWFSILDALRSPYTFIEGNWYRQSKFSSMGNGYTFELETLIFFALTKVCVEMSGFTSLVGINHSVFGDDIICPSGTETLLFKVLRLCGFSPNERKSYVSGQFRESCGGDFFNGTPVRAYYIKENPNEPQEYIALANGLRRVANQDNWDDDIHPCYLRAWRRVVDKIPSTARNFGPKSLGDIVIHDRPRTWKRKTRFSIHYIRCYMPVHRHFVPLDRYCADTVLASALYGISPDYPGSPGSSDNNGVLYPRDCVTGFGVRWVAYS